MSRKRILLVEDSGADVQLCEFALAESGLQVDLQVARDGEEALDALLGTDRKGTETDLPNLVLLDLKLPLVSGPEVLTEIRRNPATGLLPVVIMTSSNQPRDIQQCYAAGANAYVMKPGDFDGYVALLGALHTFWIDHNLITKEAGTARFLAPQL